MPVYGQKESFPPMPKDAPPVPDYFNRGPVRDPEHLKFVRSQPCCVPGCKRGPIEANHVGGSKGMGQKCSDLEAVPMCQRHHRFYHDKGRKHFEFYYRLDVRAIAAHLAQEAKVA